MTRLEFSQFPRFLPPTFLADDMLHPGNELPFLKRLAHRKVIAEPQEGLRSFFKISRPKRAFGV